MTPGDVLDRAAGGTGVPAPPVPAASRLPSWARGRVAAAAVVVLVLGLALVLGLVASGERRGYLDPDAVDRSGARAVVRLLEAEGVTVVRARRLDEAVAAAGPGSTVLVTVPDLLREPQVERLVASGADLVLVGPTTAAGLFLPGAQAQPAPVEELRPRCELELAARAGRAVVGGTTYDLPDDGATGCYPSGGRPSLVQVDDGARTTTLLGAPQPLTNEQLDAEGDAALALGLLGAHPTLVWYRPVLEELPGEGESLGDLLPRWVAPVALQLLVVAALAALWRGRRLGPLAREPLPVAVPAAEAVRGRARLYRRSGSRDHAARVLRAASLVRLRRSLALPPSPADAAGADVVPLVAARSGWPAAEVAGLLGGPAPADDAALVRLADDLDRLETEVRHP